MAKNTEKAPAPTAKTPGSPAQVMGELHTALVTKYLERGELVDCMLVALVSGEHLIMIGPPGTAKSGIARDITKAIQGKPFIATLTKFTVPEELFGPLSLKALEQERYTRVMTGKMPEADIVVLNEVGKASSSISNTCLILWNQHACSSTTAKWYQSQCLPSTAPRTKSRRLKNSVRSTIGLSSATSSIM